MTGGRYSTVIRDPYSSGELTVDTNGDGVPDAEVHLTPKDSTNFKECTKPLRMTLELKPR